MSARLTQPWYPFFNGLLGDIAVFDSEDAHSPRIPSRTWMVAAVTGAGAFIAMADSTLVNLAIESIRADLNSTLEVTQWAVTGYLIALAVSLPMTAWLGSRYGYGRVWSASLAGFIVASGLCGISPNLLCLNSARILQGLAGGLMVPAGQAVIAASAGPRQLGRIFGLLGLVIALGPAVGPAIGGVLIELASWRWLFWINVPLGVVALIAARRLVPPGETDSARPLDWLGLALIGIGLPTVLYGFMTIKTAATGGASTACLIAGVLLMVGFVFHVARTAEPLIDLRLLQSRSFAGATATAGLSGINLYGGLLLFPLYLQLIEGLDVVVSGGLLLVMGLGSALALPVAGFLTDRYGPRPVSLAGAAALIATTVPFLVSVNFSMVVLGALLFGRGVGIAWAQMPAMTAAYAAVRKDQMGDASTIVNMVQRVGGALGAAAVAGVIVQSGGSADRHAHEAAFAMLTTIAVLTMPAAATMKVVSRDDATAASGDQDCHPGND